MSADGSEPTNLPVSRIPADPGPTGKREAAPLPHGPALLAQQATSISRRLRALLPAIALQVTITGNRTVMISVNRNPRHRQYSVRLHQIFAEAPDDALQHLARYIVQNDAESSRELGRFIESRSPRGNGGAPPSEDPAPVAPGGRHHDIAAYFRELNRDYFGGRLRCALAWARNAARGKARRCVNVGSYTVEDDIVRIHPGLDQEWVPDFYVKWVLYHEMLHAVQSIPVVNGRHRFHTPEFREDETLFGDHDRAYAWERKNLAMLLRI